jgi:hypothetical protein
MPNTFPRIPRWAKRFALFVGAPVIVFTAIGVAVSASITVPTTFVAGQSLNASEMNQNFLSLQNAINDLQAQVDALKAAASSPDCPAGYAKDASATAFVLCTKGVDQIVKVGTGISAFWIDRYEATIWQNADGSGAQYGLADGAFPAGFPQNGQYTTPVYALSVAGKMPAAFLTWFQAQQACRLSGKRLPTDEEWLAAATGTADTSTGNGTGGVCNTQNSGPLNTGGRTACLSRWGAEDMIGNLDEWTANWYAGTRSDGAMVDWTASTGDAIYNHDGAWNIGGAAYSNGGWHSGLPAASLRGGTWADGPQAGVFAQYLGSAPSQWNGYEGFRCVAR